MKQILQKISIIFCLCFGVSSVYGQIVDGHAYLVGDYVVVGINAKGYEGAPLYCRGGGENIGFVANPQMDDWTEYNGDFFMPGSPECGFGLTYTLDGVQYNKGNNATAGLFEIPGELTDYYDSDDSTIVTWVGEVDGIELTIVYSLQKDQLFYSTEMTIANTGDETFENVYYYHNFDPDNNQPLSGSFSTTNTIESQSEMADDSCIVFATQDMPWESSVTLYAYGSDWKAYYGGFMNRNGEWMWNGDEGLTTEEDASITADQAIGLAYKITSLPPGRAGGETFGFGTTFDAIPTFVDEPGDVGLADQLLTDCNIFPNPTQGNLNVQTEGAFNYQIIDLKGSVVLTGNGTDNAIIDVTAIDKGTYIITVIQNSRVKTEKLILN